MNKKILLQYKLLLLFIFFSSVASAQSAYNILRWGGTLTVSPATFSAGSLGGITDGSYTVLNTIALAGSTATTRWIQYQSPLPVILSSYSITTSSTTRPTAWTFSGSNDGSTWTDLNTQTAQTFTSSTAKNFLLTGNTTAYSYYKISFTTTQSATSLAINEFELFTSTAAPFTPVLNGNALSGTEAAFAWNFTLYPFDTFFVERSLNGTNYTIVASLAGNYASYFDQTLSPSTLYYYRVRGKNLYGNSSYSNVVQVTTNTVNGQSADITDDGGRLYVSAENSGGAGASEGSPKFVDNDVATKWLVFTGQANGNLSAVYKPTGAYIVTGYGLWTSNDSPPRDPKNWGFYGSNDSTTWVRLDTLFNQLGNNAPRLTKYAYGLSNPGATSYKFYRILFSANNGATDGVRFQIAEWQIFGINASSPAIPVNLVTSAPTPSSMVLTWSQGTTNPVTGFRLQRSEDGQNFITVATLPAAATTYTDMNLYDSTTYYYRIQALGSTVTAVSGWSVIAKGTTTFVPGTPLSPRNLKIIFLQDSVVGLTWKDNSYNETGFRVQRSTDNTVFTQIGAVGANMTSYNDSTVWPATKYYYRVVAFNTNGPSVNSNVDSGTTTGYNHPPLINLQPVNRNICSNSAAYTFNITGLSPGATIEATQSLRVTKVSFDKPSLFSSASFVSAVTDGVATFTVTGSGAAKYGDTATIFVTIKDNGGVIAAGTDSAVFSFKVIYVPLVVSITADKDTASVIRYNTVHLTAATNYPSSTPNFSWDAASGIESGTGGIVLSVQPVLKTTYTVHATSNAGCTAAASITLSLANPERTISNVLTPNGDGVNDRWVIWNIEKYPANNVKVFDRAGRMVYTKRDYINEWDGTSNGKVLEEGMYYYVVDFGDGSKPAAGSLNILKAHK